VSRVEFVDEFRLARSAGMSAVDYQPGYQTPGRGLGIER